MAPPPLLGYNNNVRHRGRIFHIQTEDSGITNPRIMTHLFADGGRIVKSTRTDYSEHLERDDMAVVVKNMMKEQHKGMFVALRSGELDELIGFEADDSPSSVSGAQAVLQKASKLLEVQKPEPEAKPQPSASESPAEPASKKTPVRSPTGDVSVTDKEQPVDEKAYAASRPAAIFSVPPPSSASIFGEVGIDEKSLDDAILSYLAEDPDEEKDE